MTLELLLWAYVFGAFAWIGYQAFVLGLMARPATYTAAAQVWNLALWPFAAWTSAAFWAGGRFHD